MERIKNISFIGTGNVATHLSRALVKAGFTISWIYSKTPEHASRLASEMGSVHLEQISAGIPATDLIIISVNDDAVKDVVAQLGNCKMPLIHTSGSLPADILKPASVRAGVIYPVQTFSASYPVDMNEVALCIEASDNEFAKALEDLAKAISAKVYRLDHHERICLHIAAVFANNFGNYMFTLAKEILGQCNLPPELLHPLISETARKAVSGDPAAFQTGPAARGDKEIIKKHLERLSGDEELKEIYALLSKYLEKKYKDHGKP